MYSAQQQHQPLVAKAPRDHRIDFLRGLALVSIFINHMPGNRFENWTTRNFGFSDAAELFVLLAGVAAAFAFFPRVARGEMYGVAVKSARRASILYGAHILSTVLAVGLFSVAALVMANDGIFELIGISSVFASPSSGLLGILTGNYQLGYFNILPLYVFLILLVPAFTWLASRDLRLMLGASFLVYLAAHMLPINMPNFPTDGGWFFNPFAWQLIFGIGIALGVLKIRGKTVPWNPIIGFFAAAYVVFGLIWMSNDMGGRVSFGLLPMWIDTLHKSMLPATRLLHILALAYLLVHSPIWRWMANISSTNVLARLGRNSLPVFVVGSLLSMFGYIVLVHTGPVLWLELTLTLGGIAIMALVATASEAKTLSRLGARIASSVRGWAYPATIVSTHRDEETPTTRRR